MGVGDSDSVREARILLFWLRGFWLRSLILVTKKMDLVTFWLRTLGFGYDLVTRQFGYDLVTVWLRFGYDLVTP